jgi:FkbM family methyltransferase
MNTIRELKVKIGPKEYTISSDDDYLNHIENGFEPEMVQLFQTLCDTDDTILDVGANIGCTALLFGEISKTVYAFEPSASTYSFLEMNIKKSKLSNIHLFNYGLGSEESNTTLTFSPNNRSGGFVSSQTNASNGHVTENIEIKTLDNVSKYLELKSVDFIKIDVEGFEGHVLRGGLKTIKAFNPLVVLELNHWCLNAFQRTSIPEFFDFLRSVFPILLAVDGASYLNLHDENDTYVVMYHHILQQRFPNIVAGFDEKQLTGFRNKYKHSFTV